MDEMNYIDWDADERIIVGREKKIKSKDLYDDDDIHQFSDYEHSYVEIDDDRNS